jgi:hypothetical protein
MKCKYSYCHHGGEVEKEEAVKIGNSYFHKDCYHEKELKQQIEEYYLNNMPSCTLQILRKVIKQLIHEKNNSADYILFVLEFIHKNNKPINNPFGLINYSNDYKLKNEFKKITIRDEYNKTINTNKLNTSDDSIVFTYTPTNKKITDIL